MIYIDLRDKTVIEVINGFHIKVKAGYSNLGQRGVYSKTLKKSRKKITRIFNQEISKVR